jgi:hypothetical protein
MHKVQTPSDFDFVFSYNFEELFPSSGRLCGLAARAPGYRSRGPGFDSRRYQISEK